ncbi:MAG TPA: gluconate 2-dehydrogenase subunit 3 family protein [Longimicrobiales bacterium]
MDRPTLSRREFASASAAALGGAWLLLHLPAIEAAAARARGAARARSGFQVLTPAEAAAFEALAEHIFPPTDTPGARALGVVHFADQALGSFSAPMLEPIRAGLAELDAKAHIIDPAAGSFDRLPAERQAALVADIEFSDFFFLVRTLTLMGVFADPSYGGNRDGAGWKLIGFEDRGAYRPPFGHYDRGVAAAPMEGGEA